MIRNRFSDMIMVLLGNLLLAIASVYFTLPFHLLTGGVPGIAVVINKFTNWNETMIIDVAMVVLFIIGAIILDRDFIIKTLISTIVYPIFVTILSFFPLTLNIDRLVAVVYTGVCMGLGVGMIMRTGGSSGGTDVPPLIANKLFGLEVGVGSFLTDGIVCILGVISYGVEEVLMGMIAVVICSYVINKVLMFGGMGTKGLYIISDKWEQINQHIQSQMERGSTILIGKGGYTGTERVVLFVVINKMEYISLKKLINHIDPLAFITVVDATDVSGEGFTYASKQ